MERISKEIKIRVLALFILSNLSSLILGTYINDVPIQGDQMSKVEKRIDYVPLKLKVLVSTSLNSQMPLVLTNKLKTLYVPYVFYITHEAHSQDQLDSFGSFENRQEVIISVPKKYVSKLINEKDLLLVPQIERNLLVTAKIQKGENYEISF